jgi:hypothetical protein
MSTETTDQVIPVSTTEGGGADSLDEEPTGQQTSIPATPPVSKRACLPPKFAHEQGANILLFMGLVLFAFACASFVAGHSAVAATLALAAAAVSTVVIATSFGYLESVKLDFLTQSLFAKFLPGGREEDAGVDRDPDA